MSYPGKRETKWDANSDYRVTMIDAADVTNGYTTRTVGFSIPVNRKVKLEFAVFQDVGLTVPSATATLGRASKGDILSSHPLAALQGYSEPTTDEIGEIPLPRKVEYLFKSFNQSGCDPRNSTQMPK